MTDLSGRGVGLDVVKTAAERLGGTVAVVDAPGQGTRFTLQLPLATAIIQTLMVSVGDQVFAIPSDIVAGNPGRQARGLKAVGKDRVLVLRQEVIPFHLAARPVAHSRSGDAAATCIAVIIHRDDKLVGIGVDTVLDQMENIIKPFDPHRAEAAGLLRGHDPGGRARCPAAGHPGVAVAAKPCQEKVLAMNPLNCFPRSSWIT